MPKWGAHTLEVIGSSCVTVLLHQKLLDSESSSSACRQPTEGAQNGEGRGFASPEDSQWPENVIESFLFSALAAPLLPPPVRGGTNILGTMGETQFLQSVMTGLYKKFPNAL